MRRVWILAAAAFFGLPVAVVADGPPAIIDGPREGIATRDTGARFTFAYTDPAPGQRFECQLDGGAWSACAKDAPPEGEHVLAGLADGRHEFRVRRAGGLFDGDPMADESPSLPRTWTVDTTGPETWLVRPSRRTRRAGATVRYAFAASEPGATFACSWGTARFRPCTSPVVYRKVKAGAHRFTVSAIDALGNPDVTPATVTFRVRK